MGGNLDGFDANEVPEADEFEVLPEGKYDAVIVESSMKATKSGTGKYLELKFLLTKRHKGRYLWARLNLHNPKIKAVAMAKRELAAICTAVGVLRPTDSHDLHDIPLTLIVKCKFREDTGEMVNEVRGYLKSDIAPESSVQPADEIDGAPWE